MKQFIPEGIEINQWSGYNDWQDALKFIEDVIKTCPTWAVIIDEDCFVYNFKAIVDMIEYMKENDFTHAGMPDRGVCDHRTLQWTTLNPFFNIINCNKIRELGGLEKIDKPGFMSAPTFEIFDDLYLQMWKVGRPLYLDAIPLLDNYSTNLKDHTGNLFAAHSWMSREWKNGERSRILNVYNYAKEKAGNYSSI
jgi:hypothetical protein